MILLPKEFDIDIEKLDSRFDAITSSNYDGVTKSENNFAVLWKTTPSNQDLAAIEIYWRNMTEAIYNAPTVAEQYASLAKVIDRATEFGKSLTLTTAMENVMMGITQAGKTRAVADYCQKLQYYLTTGSLYAAIEEINMLIADTDREHLAPFITTERLNQAKAKIQTYLGQ